MKTRECNERDVIHSPAYDDSGVATSGELGEPSFSGECEGIVCLQEPEPKEIEEDENRDPRFDRSKQLTIKNCRPVAIKTFFFLILNL